MICRGCLQDHPIEDFTQRKDRSGRYRPYCKTCRNDIVRARYNNHKRTSPFKLKCSRAKSRAQGIKVPFDLTPEYLESIWTGYCPVSGIELKWETDRSDEAAAELDRFDPTKGYVKGNVVFLSRRINRLKNNATSEELRKLLEWMELKQNTLTT